jgi:N-acetyllactosaminide beta-1,3-N-acetylglucosaminyltransferase
LIYSSLDYPVNVGRNIAREAANSHFIFPSDIELYPNPGLIPAFLDMIRRNEKHLVTGGSIFVTFSRGKSLSSESG